jgi:hypothetical protein
MKSLLLLPAILEWIGLGGVIAILAYIPWPKMVLGAVMTLLGAFYPQSSADNTKGEGSFKGASFTALFKGSLRAGVTLGGIVLIVGAIMDGYSGKEAVKEAVIEKQLIEKSKDLAKKPNIDSNIDRERLELMRELLKELKNSK